MIHMKCYQGNSSIIISSSNSSNSINKLPCVCYNFAWHIKGYIMKTYLFKYIEKFTSKN